MVTGLDVAAPPEASPFDEHATDYRDQVRRSIGFSGQEVESFTRRKAALLLDLARRRLGDPARLSALDVGCGVGLTDGYLGGIGELHGLDTSAPAVERAAAANPGVRYAAYDGARMPYPDGAFDLAFGICVVHHVPPAAWAAFHAELARVVRPGGLVAIFEHNPLNPLTRVAVSRCEFDEEAVLVTRPRVEGLLAAAGLRPVERRYIVFLPFEPHRTRPLERALAWLPAGAQHYVAATRP